MTAQLRSPGTEMRVKGHTQITIVCFRNNRPAAKCYQSWFMVVCSDWYDILWNLNLNQLSLSQNDCKKCFILYNNEDNS